MKYLLLFIVILFSCEKEPDCWTCKMVTEQTGEDTRTVNVTKCNVTASDIFAFEAENTYIKIEKRDLGLLGVYVIETKKTTECKK